MKLLSIPYKPEMPTEEMHIAAMNGDVVLVKNFITEDVARRFRSQLSRWRAETPAHDPLDYYPKNIFNLHIEVVNKEAKPRVELSLDYHEHHTLFTMYNYRIGDMQDPEIRQRVPEIRELGPHILRLFNGVLRLPELQHGVKNGRNLYFEVAHFPSGTGHIEEHTHETILRYGQPVNMVMALSKRGYDFASGGLFIRSGETLLDLREEFDLGDAVFFRNDIPHWVEPVQGTDPRHFNLDHGRWSMTMFYY